MRINSLIDLRSTQQIVQSAHAVPSVTVSFQHDAVFTDFVSLAVVVGKKVDQQLAVLATHAGIDKNFTWLFVKIV